MKPTAAFRSFLLASSEDTEATTFAATNFVTTDDGSIPQMKPNAKPAVTADLPGFGVCCLVHAQGSNITVCFDSDHSCPLKFQLNEFSKDGPDPVATLVANVIDQIWSLAFAAGRETTKIKILKALQNT